MFHFHMTWRTQTGLTHWSNKSQQNCLLGQWTRLCSGSDVTNVNAHTLNLY